MRPKQVSTIPFFLVFLLLLSNSNLIGQSCTVSSFSMDQPHEWASHRNWVISPASFSGANAVVVNTLTLDTTAIYKKGYEVYTCYEGGSATSDDDGNLLFYSNGKYLYKGLGNEADTIYSGLLSGDEAGGDSSRRYASSGQGMITVRHPLTPNVYHIFTVGDVIAGGTPGLNHYTFDKDGLNLTGPTKYLNSTTEAIAATKHANGVDVWVAVQEHGSPNYHVYLITASGIDTANSNLNQPQGRAMVGDFARGGIAFSGKSDKMAECHPSGWPNADEQVTLYDFDNATGTLGSRVAIAPTNIVVGGFDVVFTPDDRGVYSSGRNTGSLLYLDISSGNKTDIQASAVVFTNGFGGYGLEIGADGALYSKPNDGSGLLRISGNINDGTSLVGQIVHGTEGMDGRGLSTSYLPPADEPVIQQVGTLCDTISSMDLSTNWLCRGADAELVTGNNFQYVGVGISDSIAGTFSPVSAGVGVHQIIFIAGAVSDTISVTVVSCGVVSSKDDLELNADEVFPNPSNGMFYLSNPQAWVLFNNQGQQLEKGTSSVVDIQHLSDGIYFLHYCEEVAKLVKQE